MARIISGSMDVTKIDKSKLIEGKNGAKYLNFDIIVNDEPDKYGKDVALTLSQSKEERAAKEKKTYIGSGKTVWKNEAQTGTNSYTPTATEQAPANTSAADDDLPFTIIALFAFSFLSQIMF